MAEQKDPWTEAVNALAAGDPARALPWALLELVNKLDALVALLDERGVGG